jgi:hypoxanthine phosphoribosyltransferase
MALTAAQAESALQGADCLFDKAAVEQAVDRMADAIAADLADRDPVLMCVMNGGLVPTAMLMSRLHFPLRVDYLHATRYRERTSGTDLQWKKHHEVDLAGRTVLVVDDILDEGYTLQAILKHCRDEGAAEVRSAVLAHKLHDRGVDLLADYVALTVPDRYVFGYGMDYKGYWRNAPGIFAEGESP